MTITKLRELGYNKLADRANSCMQEGYTEDCTILKSFCWDGTKEGYDFWNKVYHLKFYEARKMHPELFEETKAVYNKEDLQEGDLVKLPRGSLYYLTDIFTDKGFQLIHDKLPPINLDSLDNEQILQVYRSHWEKPKVKKHTLEELYKIVGYKFEIKE